MKRILAIHLLNDRSGSPNVFRQSLDVLKDAGHKIEVITSPTEGFLSEMDGVNYHYIKYNYSPPKLMVLVRYLAAQFVTFCKVLSLASKSDIIYINSMLPFGAALAAKLRGSLIIYHMHEVSVRPQLLKSFLTFIVNKFAHKAIHVSNFLKHELNLSLDNQEVIYNTVQKSFIKKALNTPLKPIEDFRVLMVCSLKDFKGIPEFVKLANKLPSIQFELVLNASKDEINQYFSSYKYTQNLTIYPCQKDVKPFYKRCNVIVNLSRTEEWLETFGMTILEGMYYGKPSIVPTKGGASELVEHRKNGFKINGKDTEVLVRQLTELASDKIKYQFMATQSKLKAQDFSPKTFATKITYCFLSLHEVVKAKRNDPTQRKVSISWNKQEHQKYVNN